MMGLTDDQLLVIRGWAAGRLDIVEIHLFGSRLHDTHRADSDVDFAILTVGETPVDRLGALIDEMEASPELAKLLGLEVHIHPLEPDYPKPRWLEAGSLLIYRKDG